MPPVPVEVAEGGGQRLRGVAHPRRHGVGPGPRPGRSGDTGGVAASSLHHLAEAAASLPDEVHRVAKRFPLGRLTLRLPLWIVDFHRTRGAPAAEVGFLLKRFLIRICVPKKSKTDKS